MYKPNRSIASRFFITITLLIVANVFLFGITFVFFANLPQYVKEPYRRFLENKLREWWNFNGTPIQIFIRAK